MQYLPYNKLITNLRLTVRLGIQNRAPSENHDDIESVRCEEKITVAGLNTLHDAMTHRTRASQSLRPLEQLNPSH